MIILIADDEPISRRVLEAFLRKWGYEVVVTRDGNTAWEALRHEEAPRLALLDWMMPGMDGVELCRKIRTSITDKYTYIILLTAKESKEDIIKGLESGADDYITKPFDAEELKCRIRIGQRIIGLEERLKRIASTDYLTGVLNRRSLMERLEAEISRSGREEKPLAVILSDIDYFKMVNDRYGHQAGDAVLQEFAACLTRAGRAYDFVGRYGGEEFLVCCPGASGGHAITIAKRMREMVEALKISVHGGSESISITASFGVAWNHSEEVDVDSIVNRADEALYRAKAEGRNRVCPATE
ncbi:MAG: diguanylate cyclase [Deltaproteobacteria bacterium]|nr:diguanylate cyclase [Deltaproteobacteria bacterium]